MNSENDPIGLPESVRDAFHVRIFLGALSTESAPQMWNDDATASTEMNHW